MVLNFIPSFFVVAKDSNEIDPDFKIIENGISLLNTKKVALACSHHFLLVI